MWSARFRRSCGARASHDVSARASLRLAAQGWRAVRRARLAAPSELAATCGLHLDTREDTREPHATRARCAM
jgi:hypothetical protein